jgi:hypothetical protein
MNGNFGIDFFSDQNYQYITIEISYKRQIFCQINKDKGIDKVEIEFFPDIWLASKEEKVIFPIDEFLLLLQEVKDELINRA